jgi:hypothetical protein
MIRTRKSFHFHRHGTTDDETNGSRRENDGRMLGFCVGLASRVLVV